MSSLWSPLFWHHWTFVNSELHPDHDHLPFVNICSWVLHVAANQLTISCGRSNSRFILDVIHWDSRKICVAHVNITTAIPRNICAFEGIIFVILNAVVLIAELKALITRNLEASFHDNAVQCFISFVLFFTPHYITVFIITLAGFIDIFYSPGVVVIVTYQAFPSLAQTCQRQKYTELWMNAFLFLLPTGLKMAKFYTPQPKKSFKINVWTSQLP